MVIMSQRGFGAILEQIKTAYRGYLDMELEVAVEELFYGPHCEKHRGLGQNNAEALGP